MQKITQKHLDRYHLLEVLQHRLDGSLHAHTDIYSVGFSMGFEPEYVEDLFLYLKVNGYIEALGRSSSVMLTPYGLRTAVRSELAA